MIHLKTTSSPWRRTCLWRQSQCRWIHLHQAQANALTPCLPGDVITSLGNAPGALYFFSLFPNDFTSHSKIKENNPGFPAAKVLSTQPGTAGRYQMIKSITSPPYVFTEKSSDPKKERLQTQTQQRPKPPKSHDLSNTTITELSKGFPFLDIYYMLFTPKKMKIACYDSCQIENTQTLAQIKANFSLTGLSFNLFHYPRQQHEL